MSNVCQKCGKGPTSGHNVSHSMRHTKRRFMPNLIKRKVIDLKTKEVKRVKICARCLRTSLKVS